MKPPNRSRSFRCHVDACQLADGGARTQLRNDESKPAVAHFSNRLSFAEENYTTIKRDLLSLVSFSRGLHTI